MNKSNNVSIIVRIKNLKHVEKKEIEMSFKEFRQFLACIFDSEEDAKHWLAGDKNYIDMKLHETKPSGSSYT